MAQAKPSVFISYAHKDAMEFTRRLAFALGFYVDVYWDRRLQTGEFPEQLRREIEARDYFIFVMTPYSLRPDGWCLRELEWAEQHKRDGIVLVKILAECEDQDLIQRYTYADFADNFDQGFRRLTQMFLSHPVSAWEYLSNAPDKAIIDSLRRGYVPGVIAKGVSEWVMIERLWPYVESYVNKCEETYGGSFFRGNPRTPRGMLRQSTPLLKQFADRRDAVGAQLMSAVSRISQRHIEGLENTPDDDHRLLGAAAVEIARDVYRLLQGQVASRLDAVRVASIRDHFWFEVAEKTRELISLHARRSRYLY